MLAVGHVAYARKDWPAAMKAFQQSAEAGNAEGAWELSLMHAHGKTGVVDKEQAREWLKIAADGGAYHVSKRGRRVFKPFAFWVAGEGIENGRRASGKFAAPVAFRRNGVRYGV